MTKVEGPKLTVKTKNNKTLLHIPLENNYLPVGLNHYKQILVKSSFTSNVGHYTGHMIKPTINIATKVKNALL